VDVVTILIPIFLAMTGAIVVALAYAVVTLVLVIERLSHERQKIFSIGAKASSDGRPVRVRCSSLNGHTAGHTALGQGPHSAQSRHLTAGRGWSGFYPKCDLRL
jgi:hypothetical protein